MTTLPEPFDLRSHDLPDEKKQELLRLFPEIRTEDGRIDFERLKLVLDETIDVGKECYGMNWPGKAECFKVVQTPSLGTLLPCQKESVNFDTTKNLMIEGDNLEVLKLLQKAYLGKVKVIYIDPPYNTGNDFIYPDNYTESLKTYLEYSGQLDNEGQKFSTNTEENGRFHSRWLNMMYPRLFLARQLLREDGVIFVSIDDHEVHNLRLLMSEVFGEENFIACIVWKRRQVSDNRNINQVSTDHEYVLAYGKGQIIFTGIEKDVSKYQNPDDDPRGPWMSDNLTGLASREERPNLHYGLINPKTGISYPPHSTRGWIYERKTMDRLIAEKKILWPTKPDGRPRLKRFYNEIKSKFTGFSSIQDIGYTTDGTRELVDIFGEKLLAFPKPVALIKILCKQSTITSDSNIVLDFFAGSCTTAQAILELNREDGGNRHFIMIQLPEPTGNKLFPTIAEIGKERIRRVLTRLRKDRDAQFALDKTEDLGVKVFKLAESNLKSWDAQTPQDPKTLEKQLEMHIEHIREGRTSDDILYELLLKSGFPLTTTVERLELAGKQVFSVAGGALMICLEKELTLEVLREMAGKKPERVVCLDAGFSRNDQLKTNAVQIFKTKGITSFKTV